MDALARLTAADAAVAEAARRMGDDQRRPICHYTPAVGWMNDPNGPFFDADGTLQLFCQHNPYCGDWGRIHWGHARTSDLVHWQRLPVALAPQEDLGEAHCFSGCATRDGRGRPVLLYSSVPSKKDEPFRQRAARPLDSECLRWSQLDEPAVTIDTPGMPKVEPDFRDPFVFRAAGRTFLLLGAAMSDRSGVLLFEATDDSMLHWRYRSPLVEFDRDDVRLPECPNFFPLQGGNRWALLISPFRAVEGLIGEFDPDAGRLKVLHRQPVDCTDQWYAPNTIQHPDGRWLTWAWIRGWPNGGAWNGCLSHPRLLGLDERGTLRQDFAPEVALLRGEARRVSGRPVTPAEPLEITCPDACADIELVLADEWSGQLVVELRQPGRNETIELDAADGSPTVRWPGGQAMLAARPRELRWLVDRSVSELLIDRRTSVTRVTALGAGEVKLLLSVPAGSVAIRSLAVHRLSPAC